MKQQVSVTGSTVIDATLNLEDQVVIVIVGQITKEGQKVSASAGRTEFRNIKINDALLLTGAEQAEMAARILDENQDTDLTVINGAG